MRRKESRRACRPSRGTRRARWQAWIDGLSSEELRAQEKRYLRRCAERGRVPAGGNRLLVWEARFGSGSTVATTVAHEQHHG